MEEAIRTPSGGLKMNFSIPFFENNNKNQLQFFSRSLGKVKKKLYSILYIKDKSFLIIIPKYSALLIPFVKAQKKKI